MIEVLSFFLGEVFQHELNLFPLHDSIFIDIILVEQRIDNLFELFFVHSKLLGAVMRLSTILAASVSH